MQNQELFKDSQYRVVHSPEEKQAYLALGWTEQRTAGTQYRVHTAVEATKRPFPVVNHVIEQPAEQVDAEVVATEEIPAVAERRGPGRPKRVVSEAE